MRTDERFSNEVEPLRRQVEQWRSPRRHRERMPQALWAEAAELPWVLAHALRREPLDSGTQ
jgi:hypothetical protein